MLQVSLLFSVLLRQDMNRVIDIMGFLSTRVFLKNYVGQVPPLGMSCVLPGGPYSSSGSSIYEFYISDMYGECLHATCCGLILVVCILTHIIGYGGLYNIVYCLVIINILSLMQLSFLQLFFLVSCILPPSIFSCR